MKDVNQAIQALDTAQQQLPPVIAKTLIKAIKTSDSQGILQLLGALHGYDISIEQILRALHTQLKTK